MRLFSAIPASAASMRSRQGGKGRVVSPKQLATGSQPLHIGAGNFESPRYTGALVLHHGLQRSGVTVDLRRNSCMIWSSFRKHVA